MRIVYKTLLFQFQHMAKNNTRPAHMNLAISAAASLVVGSMNRAANDPKSTARSLAAAILPAFGISWNRDIIQSLTRDAVNQLLVKLRNSPLPRMHYDKLAGMFETAFCRPYSLIPEWAEWKQLADAFVLGRRFPQEDIAHAITFLTARSVPDPGALAPLDAGAIETMAAAAPNAGPLRTIWRLYHTSLAAVSPNEHLPLPETGLTSDVFKRAVKRCLMSLDRKFPSMPLVRKRLNAPASFAKMGPSQKISVLQRLKSAPYRINRFVKDNHQRNLLKQIRGSLPSVVSDLNCYLQFCQLRSEEAFPATERRVLGWVAVFNVTATFYNYTLHLQNVCFFIDTSSAWLTPAVRHVANGLKKCQDKSSKFPNYIRSRLLLRLIRSESIQSEFAQACLFPFLFSFRVPSGTLQLRRSFRNDRLTEFPPIRRRR